MPMRNAETEPSACAGAANAPTVQANASAPNARLNRCDACMTPSLLVARPSLETVAQVRSRQRLAADIGRARDLHQHADAGIGANMGLLARQQQVEDLLVDRAALVQLDGAVEAQESGVEHAVALRLEVRVYDADALVVRQVGERLLLAPLPIGQMLVVEHDHAALDRDVGAVRSVGGDETGRAIVPGGPDQVADFLADRHRVWPVLRVDGAGQYGRR